jgi:phosphoserine phosphatase
VVASLAYAKVVVGILRLVQVESVEQILARIEQAARGRADGVVAFDGDGTMWSGDVGDDFLAAMIEKDAFLPEAVAAMRAEATEFGVDAEGDGAEIARRLLEASREGRFPEERLFEMTAWAMAGAKLADVIEFSLDLVALDAIKRPPFSRMQHETCTLARWVRRAGIETWVVSASPRDVVVSAAIGLEFDHLIAADAIYVDDRMIARASRPIPYGPGKIIRLREQIGDRPLYAAFGDSAFDIPLLAAAEIPVAVRPKPALRERAGEVAGLVELKMIIA